MELAAAFANPLDALAGAGIVLGVLLAIFFVVAAAIKDR